MRTLSRMSAGHVAVIGPPSWGYYIRERLDWGQHISDISTKATKTLGFLHQNLSLTHRKTMEAAYKTLTVRPKLEYAYLLYNSHLKSHCIQMEKVQRTAARWTCMRLKNTSHVGEILVSTYQICQPKQLKPLVFSTEISRWHKRNQIGCIQNACAS